MAGNGLPWFRLYSEILDDKKIKRICRVTPCSKAEVIGVWVCILSLANDSCKRGFLMMSEKVAYDLDDIEEITGVHQSKLAELMNLFVDLDMLTEGGNGYEVTNWNGRQFKSDNSSERVREHRNKKDETLHGCYSNGIERDTELNTDTDNNINPTGENSENPVDVEEDTAIVQFRNVWEQETGTMVAKLDAFCKMVTEFEQAGVTPDIYRQAIQEQKRSTYPVKNPTSVQSWAVGIVQERNKPKKRAEPAGTSGNDAILEEVMNGKF